MTTRVLFVQPYLATYRVAFYTQLQAAVTGDGMCIEVVVGRSDGAREDRGDWPVTVWPDRLGRWSHDRVRLRRGRVTQSDVVVVEHAIRNLDTWLLLTRPRRFGPAVAMWGHGRHAGSRSIDREAKRILTDRADWFFGYTDAAVRHVVAEGFPATRTTCVGNTIDTDALQADLESVTESELSEFRRSHGLRAGRTALFLGGVDDAKGIDFVLAGASAAARRMDGFVLVVAGAGGRLEELRRAEAAGLPVRVVGRVDGRRKGLVLRAADVLAIPQGVGLVAVDSLVAGVPIVTVDGRDHGPEADYLGPEHCLRLPMGTTAKQYGHAIAKLLDEPESVDAMATAGRVRGQTLRMQDMVRKFREGLVALRDIHEHGL